MEQIDSYVVGWGTLTLINAGLAQGKGRSGFRWWVASIFLGPIATLLIVVLDRAGPAPQVTAVDAGPPDRSMG